MGSIHFIHQFLNTVLVQEMINIGLDTNLFTEHHKADQILLII